MKRNAYRLAAALILLGIGGVAIWRGNREGAVPTPGGAEISGGTKTSDALVTNRNVARATGQHATKKSAIIDSETPKDMDRADDQTDPIKPILRDLARTYETGVVPVRIRLQDQLSRYWEENPPSAEELIGLVGDQTLPPELRTYLARTFANRVKMRAYSDEEKVAAFAELRELVTSADEDSLLRADLANVLTTIDDSDEAVEAAAGLLDDGNPKAVQKAVAALTHTTNPLAIEVAFEFVQDDEQLLNENPTALLAALAPLSTTDKDITPMLNHIIRQTDDFKLYASAVQCLIHARPTVAVLESIAQAYTESKRFPQHAAQAEQMCRAAARRHMRFFNENRASFNGVKAGVIDGLMKEGVVQ